MPPSPQEQHDRHRAVCLVNDMHLSYREAAEKMSVDGKKFTAMWVRRWHKRFQETGTVDRTAGSGPPFIVCSQVEKNLVKRVLKKENSAAKASAALHDHGLDISPNTVRRCAKRMGMKCKPRRKWPALTERQKLQRLTFAKKYRRKTAKFWRKWVFTDEKKYYMYTLKRTQWCGPGEKPEPQKTWAVPPQCYIWAGVSFDGKTELRKITGGLTTAKYLKVLQDTLLPGEDSLFPDGEPCWTFQQDSTTRGSHGALVTRKWLADNVPNTCFPWPANSPDLNPIENVWRLLNISIQNRKPRTADGYWQLLKAEWAKLDQQTIGELIDSMPHRLQAVIDADGGNTKY